MAGSIVVTSADIGGGITKYAVAWTADGSGNVNSSTFGVRRGRVVAAKIIPGSPTPSNGYVVRLLDPDGADLFGGSANPISAGGTAAYVAPALGGFPLFIEGFSAAQFSISGAGAAAQGTAILYVGP